ncbi:N-acetyltransferase [Brachybacterium vulturis]|uniref:N-acetyltransferase n=1 Tax=Brachybacterium vulturis TaxID=2017484 RepID=A0A291GKX4_9MICO|nr:GNAT family N-acetyltransferase [Brachybacterium vulturis]ATG50999.1 N-acetyltransferase [Brachybacterium vulturis]
MNHGQSTPARIIPVDPADRESLLAWNAVLGEGFNAGREAAWWASEQTILARFGDPKPERLSVLLVASLDGEMVGAAGADVDPGDPAEVEISVLPTHRRRGIGTALAAALRETLAGHAEVVQAETYSEAGISFALAHGMRIGNQEHRLLLDLPVDRAALLGSSDAVRAAPGIEVRTWRGACPEDLIQDWARLSTQMEADVPMGDLTRPAPRSEVTEIRRSEQRMDAQGWTLVRGLAYDPGTAVGYTEIFVNRHDPEILTQDDTLVDRAHRGRGIGRALKLANLENLAGVPEAESARWIQTYTALDNTPMLALNRSLGFRQADVLSILEGELRAG